MDVYYYGSTTDMILVVIAVLLSIAGGFGMPVSMIFLGDLFDGVGSDNSNAVQDTVVMMIIVGVVVGVVMSTATILAELSVGRQLKTMKKSFFRAILALDMAFFDKNSESLFTKLNGSIVAFKGGAGRKLTTSVMMISMFLAGFIIGFIRSWELTAVLCIPVPFMCAAGFFWGKTLGSAKAKEEARNARANDIVEESVNSIKTVVAFGLEDEITHRYDDRLDIINNEAINGSLFTSVMMGVVMGIMFLTYALGFWYSGVIVRRDVIDPCCIYNPQSTDVQEGIETCATAYLATAILPPFCEPINSIFSEIDNTIRGDWYEVDFSGECPDKSCFTGGKALSIFFSVVFGAMGLGQAGPMLNDFVKAAGSVTVLKALTTLPTPLSPFNHSKKAAAPVVGNIEFKNVAFAYPTRPDSNIFTKLDITIPHGKTTALVGGSGCGKSTIIQLLERYYEQLEGSILSNGVPIDLMNLSEWRNKIAIIPQEPRLFSLSIMENIRMGNREASDEDCIRVAMKANAHDFIMGFPKGYHTYVGTGGGQLSGGQKQRICIARSLLRDPEILILDEATSALDNNSERVVQATLDKILETSERTTIVIAHRLSTIRKADNIIVLERESDKGSSLKEQGSHDALMEKGGVYHSLVMKQQLEGLGDLDLSKETVHVDINESALATALEAMKKVEKEADAELEGLTAKQKKELEKNQKQADKAKIKAEKVPLSRLFKDYTKGIGLWQILALVFAALNGAVFPIYSVLFSFFVSIFYSFDPEYIKKEAARWALAFVGLAISVFIVNTGQVHFLVRANSNITTRLRKSAFKAVMYQDMSYHDRPDVNAGTVTELLAKEVPYISGMMTNNLGVQAQALSCLVFALALAFWAQWQIALAGIVGAFMTMIGGGLEMALNTDTLFKEDKTDGEIGSGGFLFNETILNIKAIGAFNLQSYMMGRFDKVCDREAKRDQVNSYVAGVATGLSQFLQFAANGFIFWIASICMKKGLIGSDLAALRRFNIAIFSLQMAGMGIAIASMQGTDATKGKMGAIALYSILDRKPLVDTLDSSGSQGDISKGKGSALEKVYFSYPTRSSVPIYDGVSMKIPIGKTTALVGSSGCGKSTVIQLLQRLYDPCVPTKDTTGNTTEDNSDSSETSVGDNHRSPGGNRVYDHGPGHVLFYTEDGSMDAKDAQVKSLRSQMGLVGQEPVLFDTSIMENIRYGLKNATDKQCIEAAKRANAYDFIMDFDKGFDTTVGKMGSKLSGGQKQRIAIARALVRKPTVLLLDEATSALDSESEEIVQEALNKIMKESRGNLTVVVVAHRLSTIRNADQIVVFEPHSDGSKIVEVGTHDELVAKEGGVYRGLCIATQN